MLLELSGSWFHFASSLFQFKLESGDSGAGAAGGGERGQSPVTVRIPLAPLFLLRLPLLPRPAFLHALSRPPERQRIGRNIFRDATRRRDISSPSNLYRRHQRRIAPNEHAIFDDRGVLVDAIVITGDSTGADVYAFTNFRIAQIAEVIRLRSLAQLDFLGLDEVPDRKSTRLNS